MDKEVMVCSECGLIDDTWTAYCSRHARSPHILIDITDIEKRVRKQTLEEVLKEYRKPYIYVKDGTFSEWLEQKIKAME